MIYRVMKTYWQFIPTFLTASMLTGCVAAATTAAGMGGSAAINHTINGITYRTFTAPAPKVKVATISALERMKIKVVSQSKPDKNDVRTITAKANSRSIEVQIEPISENATRMRVIAKGNGLFYDSATADEIILQTKRQLGDQA